MMISVLLADDDELTRTGLRLIIESDRDLTVVGRPPTARRLSTWRGRFAPTWW
jgi:YesN/AraC family two-component response regulator